VARLASFAGCEVLCVQKYCTKRSSHAKEVDTIRKSFDKLEARGDLRLPYRNRRRSEQGRGARQERRTAQRAYSLTVVRAEAGGLVP
jgi:hypothetical protein